MISYWEKSSLLNYDLIVIGGGITGMFCALSYREIYPKAKIAILERGLFSSGASTKNAGFACFGSLSELIDDTNKMTKSELLNILKLRVEGLQLLRDTLGDKNIDYQPNGGYELFFDQYPKSLDSLAHFNSLLYPIFNKEVYSIKNSKIKDFGFETTRVKHLVENSFEGQLNTGMMMQSLRSKINTANISFFSQVEVTSFEQTKDNNTLDVSIEGQPVKLQTRKIAVCNNAFAKRFFPTIELNPGRGLVLITKPIKYLKIKGSFHYNEGYYYFRNIDDRVLFGGGRDMDIKTETTTSFGVNNKIKQKLLKDLETFIVPGQSAPIEMEWSGIMGFGSKKTPLLQKVGDHIAMGVRLGGMGIAIGSKIGKATAELLKD
ncbi:MAG: glycine/D-amino acid oxidase-like deaminating enzyme [Flavobacteriaceae bacterium]|jgi:glycine/D-amino acid oxidase-like deaminating enzyme